MPEGTDAPAPTALGGLKVLELASLYAAPLLGAMLGDLGADVVKVEPPEGDQLRILGERARNADGKAQPTVWLLASRNKRTVTLDTKVPADLETVHRLTAVADVVLLNQPPALLQRMGCTYADICARNRRAVVVGASGFGADGPWADRGANGTIAEAFSGITYHLRDRDGEAHLHPLLIGDTLSALTGVVGVLAACYHRDARGGEGQFVDLAMYEAMLTLLAPQLLTMPTPSEPGRGGLRAPVRTSDGSWIVSTAYSDAQIGRLLDLVGVEHHDGDDLAAIVTQWAARHSRAEVMQAFEAARITASPLHDLAAMLAHPQTQHRSAVGEHAHPQLGTLRIPEPAPRLSATPAAIRTLDPPRGAHTSEVLRDWLDATA